MAASFTWTGLEEEYRDLRALAGDLATDADGLARAKAITAMTLMQGRYRVRSGELSRGVHIEMGSNQPHRARALVRNDARHAMVYDVGSHGDRHTRSGYNRGVMPRRPVFIRAMVQVRRQFLREVKQVLTRHGLEARGDAG
jgi:hypothetical protein